MNSFPLTFHGLLMVPLMVLISAATLQNVVVRIAQTPAHDLHLFSWVFLPKFQNCCQQFLAIFLRHQRYICPEAIEKRQVVDINIWNLCWLSDHRERERERELLCLTLTRESTTILLCGTEDSNNLYVKLSARQPQPYPVHN